jgi:HPt (histidine-containing phosphotransfer) domain-containing protein
MQIQPIELAAFRELEHNAGAEFVGELVRTFLEEAPRMIEQLIAAMADNKAEQFRRTAHSLKSNSLTFGATRLGELARQLETAGLERVIAEDAAPLAALGQEYKCVATALQELIHA